MAKIPMFGKIKSEFHCFDRKGKNCNGWKDKVSVVVVSLFLKIHLILTVSVFSSNSSLFTIYASKSGSPLFTSTL